MKTITVKLKIDPQKYEAAQQFMEEKGLDIEAELSDVTLKFYEKYVPSPVRKYIERSSPSPQPSAASKGKETVLVPDPLPTSGLNLTD